MGRRRRPPESLPVELEGPDAVLVTSRATDHGSAGTGTQAAGAPAAAPGTASTASPATASATEATASAAPAKASAAQAKASATAATAAERTTLAGQRLIAALRRNRTELLSGAVLALAILGALTSWGALDIASAAAEPAPIIIGQAND
jgi:hypothetical protein